MTLEIAVMLALLGITLAVFVREVLPIEVTAFGLLAVLVTIGFVDLPTALTGFSNKAVIAIGSLFLLSHALVKTGILEVAADLVSRRAGKRKWLAAAVVLAGVSILSGFLNNTAVVAIFIPLALQICRRLELAPSKLLLPISYASIFGGTLTLIGTSTNLLVSSVAEEAGVEPLGMFEFTRLGAILLAVGMTYLLLFSRRLLPEGQAAAVDLTEKYRMGSYLAELRLTADSDLAGKTLTEIELQRRYDAQVIEIVRGGKRRIRQIARVQLAPGDLLIVQASADALLKLRRELDLELLPDVLLDDRELAGEEMVMVESLVAGGSRVIGKQVQEIDFRELYGGFVMAIRRLGGTVRTQIAQTRLRFSDSVLMLLPKERLGELSQSDDFIVLSRLDVQLRRARFWWLPLVLLPAVVALAALDVMDIAGGALLAAIVLLVTRVLEPQEAYRNIDWSVIFLIAAFVPVGQAFVTTGAAGFVSSGLLDLAGLFPDRWAPWAAVALLYLVTTLMTQMISNAAAALILAPIALTLASNLGVDSRPLLMAVCFAASAEFMTPMGYQTNMMVYGPGGYRFLDYTRFGAPLNLVFWALAALLIPLLWGF
ncbi:MAG: SLC13 family permease [Thermoanaerobaculia bacterium]|nr:SLC13 family permease [Thermoanaerobaculia bacterium]